jgi:hypothetical protein
MTLLDTSGALDTSDSNTISKNTTNLTLNASTFEGICYLTELFSSSEEMFNYNVRAEVRFSSLTHPSVGSNNNFGIVLTDSLTSPANWLYMAIGAVVGSTYEFRTVAQGSTASASAISGTPRRLEVNLVLQQGDISRGASYYCYDSSGNPISSASGSFLPFISNFAQTYIGVCLQNATSAEAATVDGIEFFYEKTEKNGTFSQLT